MRLVSAFVLLVLQPPPPSAAPPRASRRRAARVRPYARSIQADTAEVA
ncbi:hypothetical protein HNR23_004548 [Nocardiopsis mwathae]|uniref:Uncharacterized protein n=1 Tax=Nocardiopsis mwathae TaxID=1472723 RepID=A0A7W9YLQ7_9ACTN|nr:hypothetical protein [Nocardiopsis mwathae]MBB6174488.1 hypothetical protein [Nocardiopsis mwathae]